MGGKSSNSTSTISIPPEVLAQYRAVNARASQVDSTPFQKYGGEFVAPLSQSQNYGIANTNAAAGQAQPYYGAATGYALAGGQNVNAQQIGGQQIGQFMSPYLGAVVGSEAALLNQNNQQAMAGQLGNAIQQGAFGGDRAGIAAANLNQQQNLANSQIYSNLLNQGFNTALGAAQQQQGVNLSAEQANRQALQQTAQSLAGLGAGAQTAALQGAQAQMAAGQVQQQTQQAQDTALHNQFLQEQSLPYQQLQQQANIAEAIGANSGSTTTSRSQMAARGGVIHKAGGGFVGDSEGGAVHPGHFGEGYAGGGLIGGYGESPFMGYDPNAAYQAMYGGLLSPQGAGLTGGAGINIPTSGGGSHQLAVARAPEPLQDNTIEKLGSIAGAADKIGQFGNKVGLLPNYGNHPNAPPARPNFDAGRAHRDVSASESGMHFDHDAAMASLPAIGEIGGNFPSVAALESGDAMMYSRGGLAGGLRAHRAGGGPTGDTMPYGGPADGLNIPDDGQHYSLQTAKTAPGRTGPTGGQQAGGVMKGLGGLMMLIPGMQPIGAGLSAAGSVAGAFARGGNVLMPEGVPDDAQGLGVEEDPVKRLMRKLMSGEDNDPQDEDGAPNAPEPEAAHTMPKSAPAAAAPTQGEGMPDAHFSGAPIRGGHLDPEVVSYLKSKGLPDYLASGIAAGISAESGNRLGALNPTSHAMGLGQWLGARKQGIISQYGASPTKQQQLDYLLGELHGGDPGGKYVMSARDPESALQAYITHFMRPKAGAETEGDIRRGLGAMQAGYASGGIVGRNGYAVDGAVDGGEVYSDGSGGNYGTEQDAQNYLKNSQNLGTMSPDQKAASDASLQDAFPGAGGEAQPAEERPDFLSGPKNFIHGLGHGDSNSWLSLLAGVGGMAGPYSLGTQLLRGLGAGAAAGERARSYGLASRQTDVTQQQADTMRASQLQSFIEKNRTLAAMGSPMAASQADIDAARSEVARILYHGKSTPVSGAGQGLKISGLGSQDYQRIISNPHFDLGHYEELRAASAYAHSVPGLEGQVARIDDWLASATPTGYYRDSAGRLHPNTETGTPESSGAPVTPAPSGPAQGASQTVRHGRAAHVAPMAPVAPAAPEDRYSTDRFTLVPPSVSGLSPDYDPAALARKLSGVDRNSEYGQRLQSTIESINNGSITPRNSDGTVNQDWLNYQQRKRALEKNSSTGQAIAAGYRPAAASAGNYWDSTEYNTRQILSAGKQADISSTGSIPGAISQELARFGIGRGGAFSARDLANYASASSNEASKILHSAGIDEPVSVQPGSAASTIYNATITRRAAAKMAAEKADAFNKIDQSLQLKGKAFADINQFNSDWNGSNRLTSYIGTEVHQKGFIRGMTNEDKMRYAPYLPAISQKPDHTAIDPRHPRGAETGYYRLGKAIVYVEGGKVAGTVAQ
jgi:hypothetical protein